MHTARSESSSDGARSSAPTPDRMPLRVGHGGSRSSGHWGSQELPDMLTRVSICAPTEQDQGHQPNCPSARRNSAPAALAAQPVRVPNPYANWDAMPGEIRNRVYAAVFEDSEEDSVSLLHNRRHNMSTVPGRKPLFKLLPGLTYTNRRAYNEVTGFLLETQEMEVSEHADMDYLEEAIDHLPGDKGWNSLTKLKFGRFTDLAISPARTRGLFDYMFRFPHLQKLTLQVRLDMMHLGDLANSCDPHIFLNGTPPLRNARQIATAYNLDLLFSIPRLQEVTMICEWCPSGPVASTPDTMRAFWKLQHWVVDGFEARGVLVTQTVRSLYHHKPMPSSMWTVQVHRNRII